MLLVSASTRTLSFSIMSFSSECFGVEGEVVGNQTEGSCRRLWYHVLVHAGCTALSIRVLSCLEKSPYKTMTLGVGWLESRCWSVWWFLASPHAHGWVIRCVWVPDRPMSKAIASPWLNVLWPLYLTIRIFLLGFNV